MPYILQDRRSRLDPYIAALGAAIGDGGELNYAITKLCQSALSAAPSYAVLSAIIGHLESAKLEFYRRAVAPYEDEKQKTNGDVYGNSEEVHGASIRFARRKVGEDAGG